jgi:hypothetical protein
MTSYRIFSQAISDGTDLQLSYSVPSDTDFLVRSINLCNPTASPIECSIFYNKIIKGVELVSRTIVDVPSLPGVTHYTGAEATDGDYDDDYWSITLPFDAEFQTVLYPDIYVGTNSYVTFDQGSWIRPDDYTEPALNKIMVVAGDRGCNSMYFYTSPTEWWIRWEGNDDYNLNGNPLVWQIGSTSAAPHIYKLDIIESTIQGYGPTSGLYTVNATIGQFSVIPGLSYDLDANATVVSYAIDDLIGVTYGQVVDPGTTLTLKSGLILDPDSELLLTTDASGLHMTVFGAEL